MKKIIIMKQSFETVEKVKKILNRNNSTEKKNVLPF